MNILYTITRYWPAIGGAETHVRQVASVLAARHGVYVAAHTNQQRIDPIRVSTVDSVQADVYDDGAARIYLLGATPVERLWVAPAVRLYQYAVTKSFGYRIYASVFERKLSGLVRTHHIDLIHNVLVGTEYLSHLSCQVAHRHGIPFVITPLVHEGIWGDGEFFCQVYRRADAVVALLDTERRFYLDHGIPQSNVHIVGVSPVIAKTYDPVYFRHKYQIPGKIVLFVGRKVPGKGYRELLEAAPLVWAQHPDASFVFIGPHEDSENAFEKRQDPRIFDLGSVSDEEKTGALAACDIFCLPSISEIMPTVILEAWHFGKPVIGGDIPTLRELIRDGEDGVIVRQNPHDIASAIIQLLGDLSHGRQMGAAGRRKVRRQYTTERVAGQLEEIYHDLLIKKG